MTQTGGLETVIYPSKYYSIATRKLGATTYSTTTEYVYDGDTLIAMIDQPMINGTATGSPITSFVMPDHLGSTSIVQDGTSKKVTKTMDYLPYGAPRVNTGTANASRQYIGQFADGPLALDYLNARYYEANRGQFLSQDPVFLEVGGPLRGAKLAAFLANPQTLNSYSYAENNPIIKKDPEGRCAGPLIVVRLGVIGANLGIWTNYAGGVLEKQAQGSSNPYQFDMSYKQLGTSAGLGAFELAALPESRLGSGLYAFGSSLAEDQAAGNQSNYGKAFVSGGTALVTGSLFSGLVGKVPAALATRSQISNQVFQNASSLVANNGFGTNVSVPFQTAQNAAKAVGIGNTGGGTFVGTYNFGAGVGTFNFGTGTWMNAQSTPATIK